VAIDLRDLQDAASGSVPEDEEAEVRTRLDEVEEEIVTRVAEKRLSDQDEDAWDDSDFDAFRAGLGI